MKEQIKVLLADNDREKMLRGDAGTRLANLTMQSEELLARKVSDTESLSDADARVTAVRTLVNELEATVAALTEQVAAADTTRRGFAQRATAIEDRLSRFALRVSDLVVEQKEIKQRSEHFTNPLPIRITNELGICIISMARQR